MPGTEHPKVRGDKTTLAVMAGLQEAGFGLYVPFGENSRCDVIIEREGELSRVQIKTGRLRGGVVEFNVCSSYAHHANPRVLKRTYEDEVDYFGVHCRHTNGVYLVPIGDIPLKRSAALRVEPTKNNQYRRVRWARDYEIGTVAIEGLRAPSGA